MWNYVPHLGRRLIDNSFQLINILLKFIPNEKIIENALLKRIFIEVARTPHIKHS